MSKNSATCSQKNTFDRTPFTDWLLERYFGNHDKDFIKRRINGREKVFYDKLFRKVLFG
jgi:hypothetical protein